MGRETSEAVGFPKFEYVLVMLAFGVCVKEKEAKESENILVNSVEVEDPNKGSIEERNSLWSIEGPCLKMQNKVRNSQKNQN